MAIKTDIEKCKTILAKIDKGDIDIKQAECLGKPNPNRIRFTFHSKKQKKIIYNHISME